MTGDMTILSRMTTRAIGAPVDVPLTSSRALRVALTRAADRALNMTVTVAGAREEFHALDPMIEGLPDGLSYFRLERAGALVGLMGIDVQLRAATIEMQTMGRIAEQIAPDRPHTGTDMMLTQPLCAQVLQQLPATTQGSDLEGWADAVVLGDTFENLRAAGLALLDADYRVMRVDVNLVPNTRQGLMIIAIPHQRGTVTPLPAATDDTWDEQMYETVSAAPAALRAVLHRMNLPIGRVNALQVGDVLPLYGATVGSVRLYAPDEVFVAPARLGQSAGMRAIRIQAAPDADLREMPPPKAVVSQA